MHGSKLVYTFGNGIHFHIQHRSSVRLGPLSYITSDIDGEDQPCLRESGPMEHRMCKGVYRFHRVEKMINSTFENEKISKPALFTVISLEDLDPTKIVDSLQDFDGVQPEAVAKDLFFDNQRWMRFVGKRNPESKLHEFNQRLKRPDDYTNSSYRDYLRENLSVIAYTCQLSWSEDKCSTKEYVLRMEDMLRVDKDTFYVRILSKPMVGDLLVGLASNNSGFVVRRKKHKSPSLIGVYHEQNDGGLCGHVLYTKTDTRGNPLARDRAFAIVLGPAYLLKRDCLGNRPFGPSVDCANYLYEDRLKHQFEKATTLKPTKMKKKKKIGARRSPYKRESMKKTSPSSTVGLAGAAVETSINKTELAEASIKPLPNVQLDNEPLSAGPLSTHIPAVREDEITRTSLNSLVSALSCLANSSHMEYLEGGMSLESLEWDLGCGGSTTKNNLTSLGCGLSESVVSDPRFNKNDEEYIASLGYDSYASLVVDLVDFLDRSCHETTTNIDPDCGGLRLQTRGAETTTNIDPDCGGFRLQTRGAETTTNIDPAFNGCDKIYPISPSCSQPTATGLRGWFESFNPQYWDGRTQDLNDTLKRLEASQSSYSSQPFLTV